MASSFSRRAPAAIARAMDCEWNTVDKAVRRIRSRLQEMGFSGEYAR